MKNFVIKTGGNQYLVKSGDELYVDHIDADPDSTVELETLLAFEGDNVELGTPSLSSKVKAKLLEHAKADKVRIMRFKAKSRYDKVRGFRHSLSKIKII